MRPRSAQPDVQHGALCHDLGRPHRGAHALACLCAQATSITASPAVDAAATGQQSTEAPATTRAGVPTAVRTGNGQGAGAPAAPPGARRDNPATAAIERLLLRGAHALGAAVAVLTVALGVGLVDGQAAWSLLRPWLIFLPVLTLPRPIRGYAGLGSATVARWLRLIRAGLNAVNAVALTQILLWAAGEPLLKAPWLGLLVIAHALACLLARHLLTLAMRRWERKLRVVIVGAGEQGIATAEHLRANEPGVEVIGFVDDRRARIDTAALPLPLLGTTAALATGHWDLDAVVIAIPNRARQRYNDLATALRGRWGDVYLAPELPILRDPLARRPQGGPQKLLLLGMERLPLWGRIWKRGFDLLFSSLALLCFLPLGLLIAALIKLESPGPVLFVQQRYGLGNRLFGMYKFRSMTYDPAHSRKEIRLTERDDQRVTRIGALLRRTSLDEVPQFINVLCGQMSVVGPRPHPPGVKAGNLIYEAVIDEFAERYKVRPGITGWAQVNGLRGNTFTEQHLTRRFAYDVQYIQNWSPELDLWIVLKTALVGFRDHNAF